MSTNATTYEYDSLGRLVAVKFPSGAQATYSYDASGNRTTVMEIPPMTPSSAPVPTVASLPKKQSGDCNHNSMIVKLSSGELIGWGQSQTGVLSHGFSGGIDALSQRVNFDPNTTAPPLSATIVDWAYTNASLYVVFSNGWVYSSGMNNYGQLGHGDTTNRTLLKRIEYFVTNGVTVTKAWAAGSYQLSYGGGCAYFQGSDYKLYGVGANAAGNLANASTPTSDISTPALCTGVPYSTTHATDVAVACAGTNFSCYLLMSDGLVMVAGYNNKGQLARNNTNNVTGSFQYALKTGSVNITNVSALAINGGNQTSNGNAGQAIALDSSGNMWSVGHNEKGQLGLGDQTDRSLFTQITSLTNVVSCGIGGGYYAYAWAIKNTGALYTWGYGNKNNLFQNNTTTSVTSPTAATYTPSAVSKLFYPKSNNLDNYSQLIALLASGKLIYCGLDLGLVGIDNTVNSGAYKYIPLPKQILDGTENIVDVFAHGTGTTERLFILTDAGNLFAHGSNSNNVCTGGAPSSSGSPMASAGCFKIGFMP